jgi:integrase
MIEIKDYKKVLLDSVYDNLSKKNKTLITDFLKYCQITAGDSSIVKIRNKIILIADTLNKDLEQLTLEDVREFLVALTKCNKAIATKNDTKKVLKRFIRWKFKDWSSKFNQLSDVKLNTKNEQRNISKSDLLTADEMRIIVSSVDSLKYKTILLLMQETANRPEELLKLKWKDIDFNTNEVKLNSAKTGESRNIPISESIKHLVRYRTECFYETPRKDDYVFPSNRSKQEHLTAQGLNDFLIRLERRIDFKKHLYPYLWRHSILSRMIKTLSPKVYEMYSGHSLETGMKIYSHLDTDDLKEELYSKVYEMKELPLSERLQLQKEISNMKIEQNDFKNLVEAQNTLLKQLAESHNQEVLKKLKPEERKRVLANMKKTRGITILRSL